MAKHIITISDMEGGIAVRVEGSSEDTPAGTVTKAMVEFAEEVITKANKAFASKCECAKCQARRKSEGQAAPTESKPTLH